jgi:hypothetical protein
VTGIIDQADDAAEAIRSLNHQTRDGLAAPAEVYAVIGGLSTMTARLPQLLQQLSRYLIAEQTAGCIRHDTEPDPTAAVKAALAALNDASARAESLRSALDAAHQATSHLAAR